MTKRFTANRWSGALRNLKTGAVTDYPTDGVFISSATTRTDLLQGQLEHDEFGYRRRCDAHHVEGILRGEVQDRLFRQVSTSVGQGAAAAMSCERWLAARE
jgi:thioredoxin reductase (NADPH)